VYSLLPGADLGVDEPGVGYKLRRFPLRGVIGIFIPLMVTALYIVIWSLYLVPADPNYPAQVGLPGVLTMFYLWFVISTIGLNISVHGLAGVEASMLMEPHCGASDAMQFLMHSDRTWSSPGGWLNIGRKLLFLWRNKSTTTVQLPSKLWFWLELTSLSAFIALPISGLYMELGDGFARTSEDSFIGFNETSFFERNFTAMMDNARSNW